MRKPLKLRVGVSDDPTSLQPSLNDCMAAMLQQADPLIRETIEGLVLASAATGTRRVAALQSVGIKQGVLDLSRNIAAVSATFKTELTRLVYEGGGKEQTQTELLRFEDLQLFEDAQLDQSIEVARAQQEVSMAVDDSLRPLDALISTLLGWRTVQPGLNPLRPDVFVRALQHTLSVHLPDATVREALMAPAGGLMGVTLRKLYRELTEWLRSTGVEPAVPMGGRVGKGTGASGSGVTDTVAKTMLTLGKLRKLLAGDFDQPAPKQDFMYTVPASMALLQDLKQVDALVKKLEQRPKAPAAPAPSTLEEADKRAHDAPQYRLGQQLGEEVVRLMFDNLSQDGRLLPEFKRKLRQMEPAIDKLTRQDSRFFSDRSHPARQMLERVTQRSLAFKSETDPGWPLFMASVESAVQWLDSKVVDADTFGELLDNLQKQWGGQDEGLKARREEAAKALLQAETRNMLAQKLGAEFEQMLSGLDVADFVRDFLKVSWAQVVADAQLSCEDGQADPHGYRAMVEDLIWSVQKSTAQRGRARRLVQMIPGLLSRLREGLARIGYPPELTQRFFDHLITLHRDAVQEGRDAATQAAAEAAWEEQSKFSDSATDEAQPWLDEDEVQESGFVQEDDLDLDFTHAASAEAAAREAEAAREEAARQEAIRRDVARLAAAAKVEAAKRQAAAKEAAERAAALEAAARKEEDERREAERLQAEWEDAKRQEAEAEESARREAERLQAEWEEAKRQAVQAEQAAREAEQAHEDLAQEEAEARAAVTAAVSAASAPMGVEELRIGSWVEIRIKSEWVRAQLTWSSPHATLFMFTSISGSAHSMSRRTLDKLQAAGHVKLVADRPVVDEALDQVAQAALRNSIDKKDGG